MKSCVVILAAIASTLAAEIPSFITPCKRNSKDLNKCITDNILVAKDHVSDGIPGLFVAKMEPFEIKLAEIKNKLFAMQLHDAKMNGFSDFIVSDVNFDFSKNEHQIKFEFPKLWGKCNVKIEGSLIKLDIFSNGEAYGNTTGLSIVYRFKTEPFQKKGKEFLNVKQQKYEITFGGKMFVNFENIYRNNKLLSASINKLFNENLDIFFKDVNPVLEHIFNLVLGNVVRKVFANYPFDELFPEGN